MIPIVPNVDASAAVEIPWTGAAVTACAVVVGISGCNGITYFRYFHFRYELLPACPSPKMIRTQLISLIIFLEYSRYRNFYPDNNDDATMTSLWRHYKPHVTTNKLDQDHHSVTENFINFMRKARDPIEWRH